MTAPTIKRNAAKKPLISGRRPDMTTPYFSQIVTNYDEDDPNRRDRAVSSALVSLGIYNLNGIADSKVRPDPQRALQMFQFAATTFGDANAQFNLARMHLDGAGVDKDGREAIRWLFSPRIRGTSKRRLCSAKHSSRAAKVFGRSARSASCG